MSTATLLVELLTEELPPKSLATLAEWFQKHLSNDLASSGFLLGNSTSKSYATPRRMAVLLTHVLPETADVHEKKTGPSVKASAEAVAGFARKNGVTVDQLFQVDTEKGKVFAVERTIKGAALETALAQKVTAALKALPIRKLMRWGDGDAEFVRPVHGLVMLYGASVVPGTVLGIASGNKTRGHRFMGEAELVIADAEAYETVLAKDGMVIADFAKRRAMIDELLQAAAKKQQATLGEYQDLLDEVTALVEHPSVYTGAFDSEFLEVPQECLILTMRQNQKYFPLFDGAGKLTGKFLIVSNMQVADPVHIVSGNQRVIRPRLEDARFFYNQDRRDRLEARVPRLGKVVYHNKLGTQLERVERVQLLAGKIARLLKADAVQAERAAWLAKADLVTGMVGEFPELQGIMGRYYALHDGEPAAVADAIAEHYQPRFAGDQLPESPVACAAALADKLETLAGLFGIGQLPTGDRDPFALRRHALGVIRILIERNLPMSLDSLIKDAFAVFPEELKLANAVGDLKTFVFERMRGYFADAGYTTQEIDAVLSQSPGNLNQIPLKLAAVRVFSSLPEAKDLAAANKRVLNIINKNEDIRHKFVAPDRALMTEAAEIALMEGVEKLAPRAEKHFAAGEYQEALQLLAHIKPAVDRFFTEVMVMVDDAALRNNRAALLQQLGTLMNRVADISKLAA
ncbi:MAG: glycine--tRNA ligase subunit beta [Burkholderiales bacterium]